MMRPGAEVVVFLCVQPVDMRKQAAGLALLIEQSLGHSVFEPALYVFSNRRHDRVRIVYWERNGLCLWSKRVEKQQFIWPRSEREATVRMSGRELNGNWPRTGRASAALGRLRTSLHARARLFSRRQFAIRHRSLMSLPSFGANSPETATSGRAPLAAN